MTDISYTSHLLDRSVQTRPNATWGVSIAAVALALLIGLSAADLAKPVQQGSASLDGRGKWAGYMQ